MRTVVGTVAWDTLALVPRLAVPETTAAVATLHADVPGGTGGNVAMALAKLGDPPRLVASVGPDFTGSAYARALEAAGVDLGGLVRAAEGTSRAYVFVDGGGAQATYFYAGASTALRDASPRLSGRVHFAAGEIAAYPALMRQAERVSFDPGQELFHRDVRDVVACLDHVHVLFLNRHEAERLHRVSGLDVPALLARDRMEAVVETRGPEGTIVHTREGADHVPGAKARLVDPTGAGDAHRAGFLHARDRGLDWVRAARFANVVASFAIEGVGPQATLPARHEAERRYEATYGERP